MSQWKKQLRRFFSREFWRTHWAPWILIVVIAIFFLIGMQYNQSTDLCKKVDRLDFALIKIVRNSTLRPPKPGEYGYAYYKAHPEEQRALKTGQISIGQLEILRSAACDPSNLGP